MRRLRSVLFNLLWAGWTALFGLAIPVLLIGRASPPTIRLMTRLWARGFLALLAAVVGVRYVKWGADHKPEGPCLIVANHQSAWETVAALVLFPDVAIVAKRELLRIPVLGWFLKRSPMIIIDRSDGVKALRAMKEACVAAIEEGRSVLIFPEGSRKEVGAPLEFKRGVELLYRTLGVSVLPVALNSGRFWKLGHEPKVPGTIIVSMLTPIEPGLSARRFFHIAEEVLETATFELAA
jgi:1-acyl-sn-glycerol-3-phosphate acyltransferase